MTRVFSGIQPTGQKHIGNYLGAIRHYVADQERYGAEAIFCVVDLHSMTQPFEPAELTTSTRDTFATLVASGLDPERAIVFVQSHVHEHAELAWLFNCIATMGELERMVAFKEKSAGRKSVSVGLLTYPVLQAADILLYLADRVPVGEDQRQHLELARDIGQRFNSRYGELFPLPQAAIPPTAARISDLQEPERKMSTSSMSSEDGKLLMLDEPDVIRRKFKRAVTDSGSEIRLDWEAKPGVSNLLEILQGMTGEPIPALEARYDGQGLRAPQDRYAPRPSIEHLDADPRAARGADGRHGRARPPDGTGRLARACDRRAGAGRGQGPHGPAAGCARLATDEFRGAPPV